LFGGSQIIFRTVSRLVVMQIEAPRELLGQAMSVFLDNGIRSLGAVGWQVRFALRRGAGLGAHVRCVDRIDGNLRFTACYCNRSQRPG
jgi:hypothetical protein